VIDRTGCGTKATWQEAALYGRGPKADKKDRHAIDDRRAFERGGGMADQLNTELGEDPGNPYAAPLADLGDPWSIGAPEALALRWAHRRDESYVKLLAIANVLYVLLFGPWAGRLIWILMSHTAGWVNAPWVVNRGWLVQIFVLSCMPIAALGAAWGFFTRKRWALWFEQALAACWGSFWALQPLVATELIPALELIGTTALFVALALPMLNAWDLRSSAVFDREYSDAIAATRHIGVLPKLSLDLTLIAIVLLVVGIVLMVLSSRR
jgi:hypothetical protein